MAKLYKVLMLSLVSIIFVSCSQDLTFQEAMNKNQRKIEDPGRLDDAKFVVEAKSFNLLEKKLSQLAITSGYAATVVAMAKKNSKDYNDLDEVIDELARKEKIAVPTVMNETHQADYYKIANADKEDFDKDYITALREINQENMQRFLTMATEAKDADVRAFAARKLDVLRNQALRMDEVEKQLLNTY